MTLINLDTLHLGAGSHISPTEGACLLEAVALFAGEPFTDHPRCVSPVLIDYGTRLNDVLPDDLRQQLKPFIPRMVGTANDGQDEARSYLAADWLIRTYVPASLDLRPDLADVAAELRALPPVVDEASVVAASPVARRAWDAARDTEDAAIAHRAEAAAEDATWAAAWAAAWAAGKAVRGVIVTAAYAVHAAARDAARDSGYTAPRAEDVARNALQPTVDPLQRSAIDLFDRMINPCEETP